MSGAETKKKDEKKERRFSQEQYDILKSCSEKKDITDWNRYRKENPAKEVLLEGADLQQANLENADLRCAALHGADLRFANLQGAILWFVALHGADLRDANLQGADLRDANLQGANLRFAALQGADLREANLQDADLRFAALHGADLRFANLQGANLQFANLQGANLRFANLQGANLWDANLQGANLRDANLQGARLWGANLQGADLRDANLQGADLRDANLQGADLRESMMQNANFTGVKLQGADFSRAIVDGGTLIWNCKIDRYTKFEGVGLDAARIYPGQKQLLEYNIRRMNWEEWYKYKDWYEISPKEKRGVIIRALMLFIRWFWSLSDYGKSTLKIIAWFFGLALLFAGIYWLWPGCVLVNGIVGDMKGFVHALYFSVVTMTTLGFGDIAANPDSWQGQVLLMFQVILGYVLLGALVTRFAVLFTAGGPAGKFAKKKKVTPCSEGG